MPIRDEYGNNAWMWPFVQAGAEARLTTSELWAELRGTAEERGFEFESNTWRAVNQMRSIATRLRTGWERFQRAPDEAPFTNDMAALDINARPPGALNAQPEFIARFEVVLEGDDGEPTYKTLGVRAPWARGWTAGDLRSYVEDKAERMIGDDGTLQGNFLGVVNIRPSLV